MTVSSTVNRVSYDGTGALTPLAVSFPFHAKSDLFVVETVIATGVQATLLLDTDYSITGTVDALGHYPNGGTVTPLLAFATTVRWAIYRDPARTQGLDLGENDNLPAESVEAQFDYVTMLSQRNADLVTRTLRQPEGDEAAIDVLPSKVSRAGTYLGFDDDGNPVALAETTSLGVLLTATSSSSLLIGTGSKTFTVAGGKNFNAGQFISAVSAADHANYMHGTITSYSGTSLIVNITDIGGSGTKTDWLLSVSGSQGTAGTNGADGAAGTAVVPIATAGGPADALTADYTPDITLTDLQLVAVVATAANATTTPTFTPDGLTTHTIVKKGGQPLRAGDIPGANAVCLLEYNAANTRWELLNPATGLISGTVQATTSGTAKDFTGIPAGVKKITMGLVGVSLSGNDDLIIQIGDSGGFETSAYTGYSGNFNGSGAGLSSSTAGFIIRMSSAGYTFSGTCTLVLVDAATFTWACSHAGIQTSVVAVVTGGGSKSLSAELTQIRITRTGSSTFDAGKVNILYE